MIFAAIRPRPVIAMDKSVRSKSPDGHLHVATSPITKANVCPYLGREIPRYKELGLDPDKIYRLFRDPEELAKGACTFNNLPILIRHVPITAERHPSDLVVGTTGSSCEWAAPYLTNSLAIWDQRGIAVIESDQQKELSSAYRYEADMQPGEFEGLQYDGTMRNIVGNHVALVPEGRAGSDVVVMDGKLERPIMALKLKSRKALFAAGALGVYLAPKLAQDAKLDLTPALKGVTAANFKARKPRIIAGVMAAATPLIAQDAELDVEEIRELVDVVEAATGVDVDDDQVVAEVQAAPSDDEDEDKAAVDADGDKISKLMAFLEGKLSDEDMAAATELVGAAADDPGDAGPDDDDKVPKAAMDAAIKKATGDVVARMTAAAVARVDVKPLVGEVSLALDSAAAIYRVALDHAGVDVTGVPESAYGAMVRLLKDKGDAPRDPLVAQDAAAVTSFQKRFPGAAAPRSLG